MGTWLGAQEAHYASILWHLDVPVDYASQVDATRTVFPGKALVNAPTSSTTHANVSLTGGVDAWITDLECATSMRPKLYGFDYARVSEVHVLGAQKRLAVELSQADRVNGAGVPGERAMMKDLILSTMREGGEVCITWHMLNPFLPAMSNVKGENIGAYLGLRQNALFNVPAAPGSSQQVKDVIRDKDLSKLDFVGHPDAAAARAIIEKHADDFGDLLEEILANPISGGKDVWLRLLHEPNIGYFWWGEPNGAMTPAQRATYHINFRKFWKLLVDRIKAKVNVARRDRVKFVFCINGEAATAELRSALDHYFPTTGGPATPDVLEFLRSIDVLGLDYYEDWAKDPATSKLGEQYEAVMSKVMDVKTAHNIDWEHALTEVSVRTGFKGRLYGRDGKPVAQGGDPALAAWPDTKRKFFEEAVLTLITARQPKWALFWVNRVGNSVIDSYSPSVTGDPVGDPPLFYGPKTNLFVNPDPDKSLEHVEHFFPIYPAEPFYVETIKAGETDGSASFFRITGVGEKALGTLPGAMKDGDPTEHGEAYKDAITDFFHLVPAELANFNRLKCEEVEKFLCDPTLPRPDLARPTLVNPVFETL